jgi:hypothetical protein
MSQENNIDGEFEALLNADDMVSAAAGFTVDRTAACC